MTIREWMAHSGALLRLEDVDENMLDNEMTSQMMQQIDEEMSKAVVYDNSQLNREFTKEKFGKLLDDACKPRAYNDFVYYAFNEYDAEVIRELYPDIKVQILPQNFIPEDDKKDNCSVVYAIPIDNSKLVRVSFVGDNGD